MTTIRVSTKSNVLDTLAGADLSDETLEKGDVGAQSTLTPQADVVLVPADELTAARSALDAGESLSPESLEELFEGAPPAAEELVHVLNPVDEVLLDEGEPMESPADDDLEVAWVGDVDEGAAPEGHERER